MEDEFELSLELSIGGCYRKSNNWENIEGEFRNQCEENPSRSEFLHGKYDVVGGKYRSEFVDMQRERARQALRRREHREAREIDGISEEFSRKNQKNISVLTENKILGDDFAGKQMQTQIAGNGNGNESRNSSIDCGSSRSSSSIFSDYRSTSLKGGSSSETESLSNSSVANQNQCVSRSDKIEGLVVNPSSKTQTQSNHVCSGTQNGGSVQHMPRVSARGNDPNGKTITGVLYKYTKSEVCIMCACHGASFTPAEFVQHAGGTDISHPLKHITILPSR